MKKYLILMTAGIAFGSSATRSGNSDCSDGRCSACHRCAVDCSGPVCDFTVVD